MDFLCGFSIEVLGPQKSDSFEGKLTKRTQALAAHPTTDHAADHLLSSFRDVQSAFRCVVAICRCDMLHITSRLLLESRRDLRL